MSYLTLGLSAPSITQFATEPITIEDPNTLRFADGSGAIQGSIGVQGANTIFDLDTDFAVKTGPATLLGVAETGEITAPNGLNGRGIVLGGITPTPATSVTLSPAQVQSLTSGFQKGIWLINTYANIQNTSPFPGLSVLVSVLKGSTLVGQSQSYVGSDSAESFGNYMSSPCGFAIPMNAKADSTQSYTFTITNGNIYQIQFIPLF